jgi:hypothetical protein
MESAFAAFSKPVNGRRGEASSLKMPSVHKKRRKLKKIVGFLTKRKPHQAATCATASLAAPSCLLVFWRIANERPIAPARRVFFYNKLHLQTHSTNPISKVGFGEQTRSFCPLVCFCH